MSCARFTFRWLHQTSMWCNFAFMLITTFGSSVILKLSPISYLGFVLSSFIQFGCEEKLIVRLVKLPKIEAPNTKRTMKKWAASFASAHCAQCHHHDLKTLSWSPAACKTPLTISLYHSLALPHFFSEPIFFTSQCESEKSIFKPFIFGLHFVIWLMSHSITPSLLSCIWKSKTFIWLLEKLCPERAMERVSVFACD